ncbi:MAG: hypothetical protein ACKO04_16325 [Actinomycetes bacterium]
MVRDACGRRRAQAVGVLVVVVLLAAACAAVPSRPLPARAAGAPCTVAAIRSCALPYPSDEFTVADPSSATGRRLAVPPDLVSSRLVDQLGPGARPSDAFNGADGFAALTPVIFEFDRAVDPDSLHADDHAAVAVFDTSTGQRVPVRVELPFAAVQQGAPGTVVMVWPQVRWEYGRTYVARVDDRLRSGAYGELRPTLAVLAARGAYLAGIKADLAKFEGDRWRRVLTATRFTVRSQANATAAIDAMAAAVRADDHPVRNLEVGPSPFVDGSSTVVRGEVRTTDFRDAAGAVRPFAPPSQRWVKFLLVLPARPAGPDGAPVAVYGHGITAAKETMLFVASTNARAGLATIGIDVPNHGDRQATDGGYVLDLRTPSQLGRLTAMTQQGTVDTISLVRAVQVHLRGRDLGGPGAAPDGKADLDTDHLLYVGTSMGSVLGVSAVALVPEFRGAFLQVPGTGIADIIYHSLIWPLFSGVVPVGGPAGDALSLLGAATMLFDPADNVNLLDRIRARGTPVFVVSGVGDAIVPNSTSARTVALLGVPLVGRTGFPVPGAGVLAADGVPTDGRGAAQDFVDGLTPEAPGFAGHLVFASDRGVRLLDEWVTSRVASFRR